MLQPLVSWCMHDLGQTRSANRRDHFLLTPDTFVRTPLPGLTGGMAIVHVAPAGGAAFTQMTIELEPGGILSEGPTQRLLYVLDGRLTLAEPGTRKLHKLAPGSFAYLPTGHPHVLKAVTRARVAVIDKPFLPVDEFNFPEFLLGREQDLAPVALNGDEGLQVRSLLPATPAFDFACNTMTYAPGAALAQVEIHYMEHGLLMLDGGGIYRLGDSWYPTAAGDFIWMAPYCPQWFGCIGKTPAKYLIYKDFNRHPLG
jgi:(S)-ureidoglycine aminohydrolase